MFVPQAVGMFTWKRRLHLPTWTTRVMLLPTGVPGSEKVPSVFEWVDTSGDPAALAPHTSHVTPSFSGEVSAGSVGSLGM
jgi:hypothetical protein